LSENGSISNILSQAFTDEVNVEQMYADKLASTGLKHSQVAKLLSIDRNSLGPIIQGTAKQPSIVNLLKVGEFLGVDMPTMMSSLLRNKSKEDMKELENARKAAFIANNFDLSRLKEVGFFKRIDDVEYVEKRLCAFFSIPNIFAYENIQANILFSRTKNPYDNPMIDFWMKASYGYFELLQNEHPYNRDLLKSIIPKIRPYTRDPEKGLLTVIKALYNAGVTVIFQKHLSKTQIRGATIIVDDKPCIAITDLNQNYATIWFALLHELHHVLYDLDMIRDTVFHLTGEGDLFLVEDKANDFARDILFSSEKLKYISPMIHNQLVVDQYAEQQGVHPSIIYSFYQYEMSKAGKNYYGAFKEHFPDISKLSKTLNINLWSEESINETVAKIKETFKFT
jgi:HTH-type transcriptional regulator/antitoxin HigA